MQLNVILAGVGGQGILTIARAISLAARQRGLHVKQSEVHGMAQRGGAVQSHLRLADREIFSDLIPQGRADLIIAVEPLESLRCVQYLREDGVIVSATDPVLNIPNYPPIEQVLDRVARRGEHVLVDADRLARLAGSSRTANAVILGAAARFLEFDLDELAAALEVMFGDKGAAAIEANRRALRLGNGAASAYVECLRRGASAREARAWIERIPADRLAAGDFGAAEQAAPSPAERLSAVETQAVQALLNRVREAGRQQLFEHEVYTLIELVGAISPPRYHFVARGEGVTRETLAAILSDRVVLKLVSPDVVHKSDAQAVLVVPNDPQTVNHAVNRMLARHESLVRVEGVLIVEFVEHLDQGFGSELFVGIRATREFGPVIAAGLGGVDTEYLAGKMLPGVSVAKAVVADTDAQRFFEQFRRTAAYDVLAGRIRGHRRALSDGELLRCFRAFLAIARGFCTDRPADAPALVELEVNPFAFRRQRLVPLDGRARLGSLTQPPPPRPADRLERLLEPRSIAVLGVSATSMNYGRIILNNIRQCGFPIERLYVVKPDQPAIDGVRCVPDVASLPEPVDLLIIASQAAQLPWIVPQVVASGKVSACVMIPGGVGETAGSAALEARVREAILAGRARPDGGPVFLGPNCMGIQSRPGRYDTFFVPPERLDPRWSCPARPAAIISQSGAFIVSRLSNLECLDPALTVSIGNQIDLTLSDVLAAVAERQDTRVIGVYAEGFANLDGPPFLRAVERAVAAGKLVIFYKAGRTEAGRSATSGHTASVAGDYDVCQAAVAQAGGLVVDTLKEFEQLMELATALHAKRVAGRRIAAVTNAGFEAVAMADAIAGARYRLEMARLPDATTSRLTEALERHGLRGLANPCNPLDLTSMANEAAFEDCARIMLDCPTVDALVVSMVPMAPHLLSTPDALKQPGALPERLPRLLNEFDKPVVAVIDAGPLYDALARSLRFAGVPVYRSCDQAVRSLGRYLCQRAPLADQPAPAPAPSPAIPDAPRPTDAPSSGEPRPGAEKLSCFT